jgi:hypothetical protein
MNADQSTSPGQPDIVDYDNRSVDLKWTPPASDGGSPIDKYIIEKKDKYDTWLRNTRLAFLSVLYSVLLNHNYVSFRFKPDWEKAAEVPGDKLECKVGDLKERGEYQFRIIAVNKAGPSPPSDPTDMHLVKHKLCK